ncbi:hypothetical protein BIU82_17030 [Arthrobacter sp. SW1]|uniref:hypothetical protein n=1 Tax=Arthrobacter sp. SW1 TaxID=1920889 RepID=UPI000877E1B3|nr:hypothetical protein [Arthrobacter sp. SW1]OFI38883.1 hypothetical protein BIU82_17030 [Arthrobacter sp. SW1]
MRSRTTPKAFRAALAFAAAVVLFLPVPATAAPAPLKPHGPQKTTSIVLPGAGGAEGIAAGKGTTFYAGDLATGDIFRGDIRQGTAELFIDAPDGRVSVGMKFDRRHELLFVAGGPSGAAYVYDTKTASAKAAVQLTGTQPAFINDVALTREGAWFTNSNAAELYFVPLNADGSLGTVRTLALSGPAADTASQFNLNGIAAAAGGRTLIVAHSGNAALYTVDPESGASAAIAGVEVPNVDGILVRGRTLWAVQNFSNQISRVKLSGDLSSGVVKDVITSPLFQIPTTAANFGGKLAVVNAKFGVQDPENFNVVVLRGRSR